jgi:O-antigen/teichoic acid export membrane protein
MNLLTLSVVFACSHRISTAVWTMALVSWLLLLHDRALFRHFVGGEGNSKPGIDSYRNAIRLAVTILPAGAAAMLSTLANNVPLYFLGRLQGNVAIGRFYPLVHAQFAGTIIVVALCQSLAGSMAAAYLTHDRESLAEMVRKVVGASLLLGIACLVGAELFGPSLMRSLYGEDFSVEPEVLRVFMAANGVAFVAAALGQIVLVTRQFDRLWLPYVAVPIVGTIGAALLVPAYGRMGVALSFAIVSVARCLAPLWIGLRTRDRLAPAFIQ